MASVEKLIKSISESGVTRVAIIAFMVGIAWARFEYKSDRDKEQIANILEKHVLMDAKEKEMIQMKIDQLNKDVADNNALLKSHISEFIRGEEVTFQSRRNYD